MTPSFPRCTRCIQSAAFPGIRFDEHGVCNFCRGEAGTATTSSTVERARGEVAGLFANRPPVKQYDAIMCYSGGKDSTYALMLAVRRYKLRVLSFTLDNGFIAPETFSNIARVVDHLGVDHLTLRPSRRCFTAIVKACALKPVYRPKTLTRISSICNACISIVNTTALRIALEKDIPFILTGFTLGQIPANAIYFRNNHRFLQESRQDALERLRQETGPYIDDYFSIPESLLDSIKQYPHSVNLLALESLTEAQILEAVKATGWEPPRNLDGCSTNCRLNVFNNFVHEKTFGYNPYELELSHLIRRGMMTRDEAIGKITDQPRQQLQQVMAEVGIQEQELDALHRRNE